MVEPTPRRQSCCRPIFHVALLGVVLILAVGCSRPANPAPTASIPAAKSSSGKSAEGPESLTMPTLKGDAPAPTAATTTTPTATTPAAPPAPSRTPDVGFHPTPSAVVEKMLELAGVKPGDTVYDLGCGDGRIVVAAAKLGAKAIGVELDPALVKTALTNIEAEKVQNLASIRHADLFNTDFNDATVVMLYLLPELNTKLLPQLEKLKPGTRIVSHAFDLKGFKPKAALGVTPPGTNAYEHTIYLWVTPLEKETK